MTLNEPILLALGIAMCTLWVVFISIIISWHELILVKRTKRTSNMKVSKKAPLVTVIVDSYNNERNIKSCLESILSSTVHKIELVVIDNKSDDRSVRLIKDIMKKYPKRNIRLVAKRKHHKDPINYRRYSSGEFVALLSGSQLIPRKLIKDLRSQLLKEPRADGVIIKQAAEFSPTLSGLVNVFLTKLQNRENILTTLRLRTNSNQSPIILRRDQTDKSASARYLYDDSMGIIETKRILDTRKLNYSMLLIFFSSIITSLMIAAILTNNLLFFVAAWSAAFVDIALVLHTDSKSSIYSKLRLLIYAPLSYIIYLLVFVSSLANLLRFLTGTLKTGSSSFRTLRQGLSKLVFQARL